MMKESHLSRSQPLLADPRMGGGPPTPYNGPADTRGQGGYGGPSYYEQEYDQGYGPRGQYGGPPERYGPKPDRYGPPQRYDHGMGMGPPQPGIQQQGSVVMVYSLSPDRMNCDRLFNLFCLYGNVVRVKFLRSKEGAAMVQMGDQMSLERVIHNLQNTFFFGNKMQLGHSKQAFLQDVTNPHELPDGTSSYKDYMGNRNNRFTNPESAQKNRIQGPAKVLHYFNAPPNITEDELMELFENAGSKKPLRIKQFPSKTERSSTGLLEFENKGDAVEALVLVNHVQITNPSGKNPYFFKLCFSSTPIIG